MAASIAAMVGSPTGLGAAQLCSSRSEISGTRLRGTNIGCFNIKYGSSSALSIRADSDLMMGLKELGKKAKVVVDNTKVEITRESVLDHLEDATSERQSVVGKVPSSGGTFPRPEIERRPETGSRSFGSIMAFDGAGPETINGRLAALGIVWAIVAEFQTHQTVVEQLFTPGSKGLFYFLAVAQIFIYASLVPLFSGESPDSRRFGPFIARNERWNGRLAMIGFAALIIDEVIRGQALIH